MTHPFTRRDWIAAAVLALAAALTLVYALNPRPTFLDSYYHYNAAARWASGAGLTDTYLWLYLGLPPELAEPTDDGEPIVETPSHLYWMPATSLLAGVSMKVFGVGYAAAQLPMALCLAGAVLIAGLAGGWLGGSKRHAAAAMLLMLCSGSYADMWGETDTFAPYALFGAGALAAITHARIVNRGRWWFAAGLLCGAGHLTRSDGLLLLMVGALAALLPHEGRRRRDVVQLAAGYLLVMAPWFVRMSGIVGAPLPLGGLQTAYLTEYEQIFRYPWRDIGIGAVGLPALLQARLDTLPQNAGTFFVSEGWLVLWPLMLWGLFRANRAARLTVGLFALGLHAAMALVFAWPAARGGLFHGAAALMPWWAALTVLGADALADRMTRRRRRLLPFTRLLLTGMVVGAAALMTSYSLRPPKPGGDPESIAALRPLLNAQTDRVMATDPGQNYYHLGVGGVVLPDAPVERLQEMAETFDLDYLVLEGIETGPDGALDAIAPLPLKRILADPPPFLELAADLGHTRLYRFLRDESG